MPCFTLTRDCRGTFDNALPYERTFAADVYRRISVVVLSIFFAPHVDAYLDQKPASYAWNLAFLRIVVRLKPIMNRVACCS